MSPSFDYLKVCLIKSVADSSPMRTRTRRLTAIITLFKPRLKDLCGMWLMVPFALAAESPPHDVVLSAAQFATYSEMVRTNHPALRAAHERRLSAEAAQSAVRAVADPTVRASVSASSSRGPRNSEDGNLGYGVEQRLPIMGKENAARELAAREASSASVQEQVAFETVRRDAVRALLQLARAEQELALNQEDNDWHALEARTSRARYEAGEGSSLDVLRFESEHAQRRTMLQLAEQEVAARRGSANRALGFLPEHPLATFQLPELVEAPAYNQTLAASAAGHSALVRKVVADLNRAEQQVKVTQRSGRPDITVGLESSHYSGDGGWREGFLTVSSTLPWFNRSRYRKDVERDAALLRAVQADLADVRLTAQSDLFNWLTAANTAALDANNQQREVLPRAEAAFQAALTAWIGGKATLTELFETRRLVIESRLRRLHAVADQWEALNEVAFLCGDDLTSLLRQVASERTGTNSESKKP